MFGSYDFYSKAVPLNLATLSVGWVFSKDVKGIMIRNTSPTLTRNVILEAYAAGSTSSSIVSQAIILYIPPSSTLVFPMKFYQLNGPFVSSTVEVYELY